MFLDIDNIQTNYKLNMILTKFDSLITFIILLLVIIILLWGLYIYWKTETETEYLKRYYNRYNLESVDELFDRLGIKRIVKCKVCKNDLHVIYFKSELITAGSNYYVYDRIIDGLQNTKEFNKKVYKKACLICKRVISSFDSLHCRLNRYSIDENENKIKHEYPYQKCKIGMIYWCKCCNKGYCVNCMNPNFESFLFESSKIKNC